jgi:hypothetical protein
MMYTCKMCGRKFKTSQELAGHTSGAHPKSNRQDVSKSNPEEVETISEETETARAPTEEEQQAQPSPLAEEDPGVMDRIRALFRKGRSPKQIKEQFGYSPRTVDQVADEFIEPDAVPEGEKHDGFPVTRKAGSSQEVLNPEVILQSYLLQDGEPGKWMFHGMMLLRAAMLMNFDIMNMQKIESEAEARRLEPLLKMIQVSREEMDAAAQRTRESQEQIAHQAAGEAAAMTAYKIDERFNQMQEKKKDIADTADPMKGLVARTMETIMNRMTSQMFGVGQGGENMAGPTPGMVDKRQQGG